jgi:hypothetical protein
MLMIDDTDTTEETTAEEYESYFDDDDTDDDEPLAADAEGFVKEATQEEKVQALKDEATKRERRLGHAEARFAKLNQRGDAVNAQEEVERRGLENEIKALRELVEWDKEAEEFYGMDDAGIDAAQAEADDLALEARAESTRLKAAPLSGVDEVQRRATLRKQKEAHDAELAALGHALKVQRVRDRRELFQKHGDTIREALGTFRGKDMTDELRRAGSWFADKEREKDAEAEAKQEQKQEA